jgi:UDP-N-acetylglucosamine--N-acetylmuramyl-(pentapeptide) pyrophosphoryl-undecaprenol N-acetylglucosamine transferase
MGLAYSLADVVVSRGGANSLAELMHWAKPAIVVPLPTAANNEQTKNAQYLARAGAVRVLPEKDLTGMRLLNEIEKLFAAPKDMRYLSATIHKYAKPDAAKELAEIIFSSGQKS